MLINIFKQLLPHEFRQSLKRKLFHHQDILARLYNLRHAGFKPTGVIDCGAFRGEWTLDLWKVWPEVSVLMIEPQPDQTPALNKISQRVCGSRVEACALGEKSGFTSFSLGSSNSRISENGEIQVPLRTLDSILAEEPFDSNFLKLDLQGHELKALRGARGSLASFEVVLLESSLIPIDEAPLFAEIDRSMNDYGFRLYDIVPQYYRPLDGALWQVDAMYVQVSSQLIASSRWQ